MRDSAWQKEKKNAIASLYFGLLISAFFYLSKVFGQSFKI
jgi:hypothetical protein